MQKGQAYKSFLIEKSLQYKHIETCWLILPVLFFQQLFDFFGANSQTQKSTT